MFQNEKYGTSSDLTKNVLLGKKKKLAASIWKWINLIFYSRKTAFSGHYSANNTFTDYKQRSKMKEIC